MTEEVYCIEPKYGLCNYLRVVFSYLLYCKKYNKNLVVIWNITDECPGFFLDYFQPLEGVEFLKTTNPGLKVNFCGDHWHPEYNPYEMFIFSGLQILPHIKHNLLEKRNKLNKYIAVHIRRTDHSCLAKAMKHYTDDIEFIQFINQHPDYNLYIATDNIDTQVQFYSLYKDRIKAIEFIRPSNSRRQTTIEEAILDMFICIQASHFMGSGWSSFTATIEQCRKSIASDLLFDKPVSY